jgi:hypothetical protein
LNRVEQQNDLIQKKIVPARLFPLPEKVINHPEIRKLLYSTKRFILVAAARRSYKTEICTRRIVNAALITENSRYLIGASTWTQTKKIFWDDRLLQIIPKVFIKKIDGTQLSIELINGSRIELFSADSAERIEGGAPVFGAYIDECSEFRIKHTWNTNILPLLLDANGFAMLTGVPRAASLEWKELYTECLNHQDIWGVYKWAATDVLDAEALEVLKGMYDEISYNTEILAQWTSFQNMLAYHAYNKINNTKVMELDKSKPIIVAFDFNYSFLCPLICQYTDKTGFLYVAEEVPRKNTNVFDVSIPLKERLIDLAGSEEAAKKRLTWFYGDYSGVQHQASSRGSCWSELQSIFSDWNIKLKISPNPAVDKRVSSLNARLCTVDGQIHIGIAPGVKELIKDFELLSLDDLLLRKSTVTDRTSASDALGYLIWQDFPIDRAIIDISKIVR